MSKDTLAVAGIVTVLPIAFGALTTLFFLPDAIVLLLLVVAAILSGPVFILFVVRSVNRRDDPRQVRRFPESH